MRHAFSLHIPRVSFFSSIGVILLIILYIEWNGKKIKLQNTHLIKTLMSFLYTLHMFSNVTIITIIEKLIIVNSLRYAPLWLCFKVANWRTSWPKMAWRPDKSNQFLNCLFIICTFFMSFRFKIWIILSFFTHAILFL